MGKRLKLLLLTVPLCAWAGLAWADYTLVLKNGRRITVQSYREEGRMIKFRGLGGDIGISKDQIQSIQKADPGAPTLDQTQLQGSAAVPQTPERPPTLEEEKAKEEKEYQQKLIELTGQLKAVRDRYSELLRGTTSPEPPVSHRGTNQGEPGRRYLALSRCDIQSPANPLRLDY